MVAQIQTYIYIRMGFPGGSAGKESACNAGDLGSIPGLGRSPGEGEGYLLQYSGLENSMDYSPWVCRVGHTTERLSFSYTCVYVCAHSNVHLRVVHFIIYKFYLHARAMTRWYY